MSNYWGDESLAAIAREGADLDASLADIRTILRERPGRVWSGPTGMWAAHFQIARSQPYSFLSLAGFDELSFLYHSLSWSSDVTAEINERDPYQAQLFAMRAVLAPVTQAMPSYFKLRAIHGKLAVYEASHEGYFGLVDIGARYDGPAYDRAQSRLEMDERSCGAGRRDGRAGRRYQRSARMEDVFRHCLHSIRRFSTPRGKVISESKDGETYQRAIRNPTTLLCAAEDHLLSGPAGYR